MDPDFKKKVMRNTLHTIYARIAFFAISILITPYILTKLGNDEYGLWVLSAAFLSHIALADLGFGTSLVKFTAEYDARGDREGVSGIMSAGVVFYLGISALIAAAAYPVVSLSLRIFTIPPGMEEKTRFVLLIGIAAFVWGNFLGVYQSLINGLQRMDVANGITVFMFACYSAGCFVALEAGYGIQGLAVNQLVSQAVGAVLSIYFAYRLYSGLSFNWRMVRKYFRTLFGYGVNLQVSRIAGLINFQFDKLLVNRFIDAAYVTYYDLGSRLTATVRTFPVLLLSALTPAISELEVRKGRAELYELFSRASKYVAIVSFLLFTGMMVTGQAIIEAWVGQGYATSAAVMRILSIGYLLNCIAGPVSPLVTGMGRPDYQRNAELLSLLLNVTLSILLIKKWGFFGAPVGTTIAMSAASAYYLWSFHRFMERSLFAFLKDTFLKPALSAAFSGLVGFAVTSVLMAYGPGGRMVSLAILLASGLIFVLCYGFLLFKWRYLDQQDLALLRDHLPFLRK